MAFSLDGFYPDPRGGGLRIHSYTTADAMTTVRAAGYFDEVSDIVAVNDIIAVASSTGGTPALQFTYVNSNTGGVVDVVDGLVIPATDT